MPNDYGYCRCCGQMVSIDQDYGSEDINNWEATRCCSCPGSYDEYASYKRREMQIKNANEAIDALFVDRMPGLTQNAVDPDSAEHVVNILQAAVSPVVDKLLYKVAIDIPGGVKAVICRSGKDKVSVERNDAVKSKVEI